MNYSLQLPAFEDTSILTVNRSTYFVGFVQQLDLKEFLFMKPNWISYMTLLQ